MTKSKLISASDFYNNPSRELLDRLLAQMEYEVMQNLLPHHFYLECKEKFEEYLELKLSE